jgi:hypothetical protein
MNKIKTAQECIKNFNQNSATLFLVLLLCGDLAFIILHFINALTPLLHNALLYIDRDRGYPEMYQYLKFLWVIIILVYFSLKKSLPHYFAWVLVFVYFLLDDSLSVHEKAGAYIATRLDLLPMFGLRLQDYGELAVSAAVGIFLFSFVMWAYIKGSRIFRKISKDLVLLILILIFFGIVVDMAHIAIDLGWTISFILGVLEDGGEMFSVSLILWYTFLMIFRDSDSDRYLWDCVHIFLSRRSI